MRNYKICEFVVLTARMEQILIYWETKMYFMNISGTNFASKTIRY